MLKWLEWVNGFVWGIPALFLILSVGLYLSFRTGFAQLRLFPHAVRLFVHKLKTPASGKGVSSYQSLCAALAATVGTGNIAGVAGALALGGPGALFWMLLAAVVGMVLKLAEASLAVKYRGVDRSGDLFGGPMYMIEKGMGRKFRFLAIAYAALGLIAAFGVGNATQINAVLDGIRVGFGLKNSVSRDLLIGAVISVVAAVAMLGGAKRIASFAEYLVPAASLIYVLLGLGVIAIHLERLPAVLRCVVCGAVSPEGMTGGWIVFRGASHWCFQRCVYQRSRHGDRSYGAWVRTGRSSHRAGPYGYRGSVFRHRGNMHSHSPCNLNQRRSHLLRR